MFAPLGIVFGVIAPNQIRQTGEDGTGLAMLGIVISAVAIALSVLAIVVAVVVLGTAVDTVHEIDSRLLPLAFSPRVA